MKLSTKDLDELHRVRIQINLKFFPGTDKAMPISVVARGTKGDFPLDLIATRDWAVDANAAGLEEDSFWETVDRLSNDPKIETLTKQSLIGQIIYSALMVLDEKALS